MSLRRELPAGGRTVLFGLPACAAKYAKSVTKQKRTFQSCSTDGFRNIVTKHLTNAKNLLFDVVSRLAKNLTIPKTEFRFLYKVVSLLFIGVYPVFILV